MDVYTFWQDPRTQQQDSLLARKYLRIKYITAYTDGVRSRGFLQASSFVYYFHNFVLHVYNW